MNIRLSIDQGSGQPITVEHAGPVVRIGRDPTCELPLPASPGSTESRQHACVELSAGGATLTDMGSRNGTLLNGGLLEGPSPLRVGDRIQLGFTGATLIVLALDLEATAVRKAAWPRPALLIGSAAAGVLVVLIVAVIWLRKPGSTTEAQHAEGPPPVIPVALPKGDNPLPQQKPPLPINNSKQDEPKIPFEDDLPKAPQLESVAVGTYFPLENGLSLLLRREGKNYPWTVLRSNSKVFTAQMLLSLPGYRSLVALDNKVDLVLWGNLPEFSAASPVLESAVMLRVPKDGIDLDVTLDRGRVVIANRMDHSGPARVRLRFLRETWDLELSEADSSVAIDLWGLPQWGSSDSSKPAIPTWLNLVTKGNVRLTTTSGEKLALAGNSQVGWFNERAAARPRFEKLADLPEWWAKGPDRENKDVKRALVGLVVWQARLSDEDDEAGAEEKKPKPVEEKSVAERLKVEVLDQDAGDGDNQGLGILFLAALDEKERLVDLLQQPHRQPVRSAARFALQTWLARGGQHAEQLRQYLVGSRHTEPDEAALIVRLLHFYPEKALGEPKTYADLIHQLDHGDAIVRDLSFWHLDWLSKKGLLPPAAAKIVYSPADNSADRLQAIKQWKKLLDGGEIPVRRP